MSFITKEDTVLVAIDFQEKLMPAMSNGEETEESSQADRRHESI